jgi:thiol-disulfide isomerase/thioredoxin
MKRHWKVALASFMAGFGLLFSLGSRPIEVAAASGPYPVNVYFFHTDGCGHCQAERAFLDEQLAERDNLQLIAYNIAETASLDLLHQVAEAFEEETVATPFTVIGGKHYVGFNPAVEAALQRVIARYSANEHVDVMAKILAEEPLLETDFDTSSDFEYQLPIIGLVDVREVSLALLAVVLGFLDGINPCAMWVLLFLISLVLNSKDKKRIWLIGGSFLLMSGLFYFGMMMAWLGTIQFLVAKEAFQIIVGVFALGAGGFNIYSFIKAKIKKDDGCEVTSVTTKQKIADKVRRIANTASLPLAIVGVMGLAIIVNAIELACSTGLPLIFTQILALNGIEGGTSALLILLYILFFLIDDLIIFALAVFTFKVSPLSTKIGKYAHLIGGLVMLALGVLMIFFPEILLFSFI